MGRQHAVAEGLEPGAGSTVLPGVPIAEWARAIPDRWTAPGRGASPLPVAWAVLPLDDEPEVVEPGPPTVEHSPLPHAPAPISLDEVVGERIEVYPAGGADYVGDDTAPVADPIPITRGRHRLGRR